jgi:hypothetical protein
MTSSESFNLDCNSCTSLSSLEVSSLDAFHCDSSSLWFRYVQGVWSSFPSCSVLVWGSLLKFANDSCSCAVMSWINSQSSEPSTNPSYFNQNVTSKWWEWRMTRRKQCAKKHRRYRRKNLNSAKLWSLVSLQQTKNSKMVGVDASTKANCSAKSRFSWSQGKINSQSSEPSTNPSYFNQDITSKWWEWRMARRKQCAKKHGRYGRKNLNSAKPVHRRATMCATTGSQCNNQLYTGQIPRAVLPLLRGVGRCV